MLKASDFIVLGEKGIQLDELKPGELFRTNYGHEKDVIWEVIKVTENFLYCQTVTVKTLYEESERDFVLCFEEGYERVVPILSLLEEW
jgi:hypothetical protein